MNSKIARVALVVLALIMLVGTVTASAITPYTTYTYSVDTSGNNRGMQRSPHAYTPLKLVPLRRMWICVSCVSLCGNCLSGNGN